jgi:hypothetical protein
VCAGKKKTMLTGQEEMWSHLAGNDQPKPKLLAESVLAELMVSVETLALDLV